MSQPEASVLLLTWTPKWSATNQKWACFVAMAESQVLNCGAISWLNFTSWTWVVVQFHSAVDHLKGEFGCVHIKVTHTGSVMQLKTPSSVVMCGSTQHCQSSHRSQIRSVLCLYECWTLVLTSKLVVQIISLWCNSDVTVLLCVAVVSHSCPVTCQIYVLWSWTRGQLSNFIQFNVIWGKRGKWHLLLQ